MLKDPGPLEAQQGAATINSGPHIPGRQHGPHCAWGCPCRQHRPLTSRIYLAWGCFCRQHRLLSCHTSLAWDCPCMQHKALCSQCIPHHSHLIWSSWSDKGQPSGVSQHASHFSSVACPGAVMTVQTRACDCAHSMAAAQPRACTVKVGSPEAICCLTDRPMGRTGRADHTWG